MEFEIVVIVLRHLMRWYSHPTVREAHHTLAEVGVRAFLTQLEHILLELEAMFPGLTEEVIATAAVGITAQQLVQVLRRVGVPESQIALVLDHPDLVLNTA